MLLRNTLIATEGTLFGISAYDVFGTVLILLALAGLILSIWALIDVLRSNFKDSNGKLIWVIIVLFTNLAGALVWVFWGRKNQRVS